MDSKKYNLASVYQDAEGEEKRDDGSINTSADMQDKDGAVYNVNKKISETIELVLWSFTKINND